MNANANMNMNTNRNAAPAEINPFDDAVAKMLERARDRGAILPEREYAKYVFETEIRPTMKTWGIQDRHLVEIEDFGSAEQQDKFAKVCARMKGVGAIVALIGIRGCGKTTIAAQFARAVAWRNHRHARQVPCGEIACCRYMKATDLLARFKPLYADFGSAETERMVAARDFFCTQVEFAVIDELHEVGDQKVMQRMIPDVLDRRYAARRDTLLISNQTPEEFLGSTSDSVISRLQEHGAILQCEWESWRGRK